MNPDIAKFLRKPVFRLFFFLAIWIGANTTSSVYSQIPSWAVALGKSESLIKSQPDSAYLILKELIATARDNHDILNEAHCLQQIGQVFFNYGNYLQSIDHLLQSDKIFREYKKEDDLAINLNLLGRVYYTNKQEQLASQQFTEALQITSRMNYVKGLALTYGNIGHMYEKRLMYDSAFFFQEAALKLYQQTDDRMGMAKIYENMGSIFEDRSAFDSARFYFEIALHINKTFGDEIAQIEILNNLGDVERKTGHFENGIYFSRMAVDMARKKQSKAQLASASRDMARGFEFLRKYDSAYFYNEIARSLVEQIYSTSNTLQIALLETVYDLDIKNRKIAEMALDKRITTVTTVAIAGGVLLLLILGIAIISRQRLKISKEKAINEQNSQIYETQKELMQAELRNNLLEEDKLRSSLEARSKELSAHTLHLVQKNQLLEELRDKLNEIISDDKRDQRKQLKQLAQKISHNFNQDNYWDDFRAIFDQVHQQFFINLKQHNDTLTPGELRMVALLRMSLNSADMATLLGISQDSLRVARYRLKKKLKLNEGESLTSFIQGL